MHLMAPCEALAPPGSKARSKRPADANSLTSPHKCKPVTAVAKFDRLCRSVADPAQVMVDFDRMDIKLIAIVERFDMANSAGRWRRWPMCLPT
jgi:DNA invertase Pin-like site-specific DNA recombinase